MNRKKLAGLFSVGFLSAVQIFAQSTFNLPLTWDLNPTTESVLKYSVYQANGPTGTFVKVLDVTTNHATIPNLTPGMYRFYVTASNVWGESGPSNIVQTPVNASTAPKNLRIQ